MSATQIPFFLPWNLDQFSSLLSSMLEVTGMEIWSGGRRMRQWESGGVWLMRCKRARWKELWEVRRGRGGGKQWRRLFIRPHELTSRWERALAPLACILERWRWWLLLTSVSSLLYLAVRFTGAGIHCCTHSNGCIFAHLLALILTRYSLEPHPLISTFYINATS